MNVQKSTQSYERWLSRHLTIIQTDLEKKHEAMALSAFSYFRATFYRWIQLWSERREAWVKAPKLLAVGDLHVENFGTWRDIEGRLVWGINDFDEASLLPFTVDLIRLAVSAHLAIEGSRLSIDHRDACDAILEGYLKGQESGGGALVLAERHEWLRHMVTGELRIPSSSGERWTRCLRLSTKSPKAPAARWTA